MSNEALAEIERLREALSDLLKYLDDHDWGTIPEGATADRARAAISGPVMPRTIMGAGYVYELQPGEDWTVFKDGRVLVIHPDRVPKFVWPPEAQADFERRVQEQIDRTPY